MVQHEEKSAFNVHVAGPLHLEAICLLSGGHSVPLRGGSNRSLSVNS